MLRFIGKPNLYMGIYQFQKSMFSKFIYYKEIANKMNINMPILNQQITIKDSQLCLVYGIKQDQTVEFNKQHQKLQDFDQQIASRYKIDKNSQQILQYELVKRIASKLQLDICLMKQKQQPQQDYRQSQSNLQKQSQTCSQYSSIVSLSKYREYIYREYYLKQLKTKSKRKYIESQLKQQQLIKQDDIIPNFKGAYKNRKKSIRIGQDIMDNDLKNKHNQINRWIQQGERHFKVVSLNQSEKSFKAIQKFCAMFQQQAEIIEEKVILNDKKKPVERYYAILQFSQQINIDAQFINRRWRRLQTQIKLSSKKRSNIFAVSMINQSPQIQKQYLSSLAQASIPYPSQYNFLSSLEKKLQSQGFMGLIKQSKQQVEKKSQSYKQEPMTEQQIRIRDRENRKIMGNQTIQDIVMEMEKLKARQYQMEHFETVRYKELEDQLTDIVNYAKERSKIKNKY